ncbi:MAG TPA: hypothetical protein VI911_02385 [Patescibacteria group bacterium]|nr:hypothetical protein [Patescibacteria group bacterium]
MHEDVDVDDVDDVDDPTSFTPTHTFDEYANSTKDGRSGEYAAVVRAVTYLHGSMEEFAEEEDSEQEVQHVNHYED